MKIKLFAALLALTLFPVLAQAQIGDITNPLNGRITVVDAGTCSTANSFVTQQLPQNASTTTVNLSGTFTATLTARVSNNGGATWTTAGAVAAGTSSFSTNGFTHICVDATAFTSGTVLVSISTGILQVQTVTGGPSSSTSSGVPKGAIDPTSSTYGAKFDVGVAPDVTTTSGSNIVTCPNSDCGFLTGLAPAKAGMIFFANLSAGTGCQDNPDILFGGLRETTILSVDSDTQIRVVGNSNTTVAAGACAAWGGAGGVDDTAAINAAWAAGGCTSTQYLPAGKAFISAPIWQKSALPAGCLPAYSNGNAFQAPRIQGASLSSTYIVPRPSFNFTSIIGTCPSYGTTTCTAAIGSPNIVDYEQFTVWGMGERCASTLANATLWLVGVATRSINTAAVGWCGRGGGTTLIGQNVVGSQDIYTYAGGVYFGSIQMNFNGPQQFFGSSAIAGNNYTTLGVQCVTISPGASVNSIANNFTCPVAIGYQALGGGAQAAAVFNSQNGTWANPADGTANVFMGWNSTLNLLGNDTFNGDTANGYSIFFGPNSATGSIVRAYASTFTGSGTGTAIFGAAGNTFVDQGGNTCSGGAGCFNGLGKWVQVGGGSQATNTVTASTNFGVNLGAQNIIASTFAPQTYEVKVGFRQITLGVGCGAGSNTVSGTLSWTSGGIAQTATLNTLTISANGTVGTSSVYQTIPLHADINTAISFTSTSALASAGCSTVPQYVGDFSTT